MDVHLPAVFVIQSILFFQEFHRKTIIEIEKEINAVTKDGQHLIRSAMPGACCTQIQSILESVSDDWSHLNKKVSFGFFNFV